MSKLIAKFVANPTDTNRAMRNKPSTAKPMNVKVYIRINRATDGDVSSVTFVYRLSDTDTAEDIANRQMAALGFKAGEYDIRYSIFTTEGMFQ